MLSLNFRLVFLLSFLVLASWCAMGQEQSKRQWDDWNDGDDDWRKRDWGDDWDKRQQGSQTARPRPQTSTVQSGQKKQGDDRKKDKDDDKDDNEDKKRHGWGGGWGGGGWGGRRGGGWGGGRGGRW
ncbi:unnamed protein product [Dicrocoelium dendriticum]|nr:unnamed protein product [Dicrocoelium dendriticum]